jgi:hypothetical protein
MIKNNTKNRLYIVKNLLFVLFVVFCIQFTELKIDVIKVSEVILLFLTPFIHYKKINKWILLLLSLFICWFIITLLLNPFRDFYLLQSVSVLKTPYLITIGRFFELISCINLAALVHQFFKNKSSKEIRQFVKDIFNFSFVLLLVNVFIYYLYLNEYIVDTRIVYWGDRLRGWFGEGGPYGLMLGFTFCLSFFYKSKYHLITRTIILLVITFLADSKAGFLLVLVWYLIFYYKKIYKKLREFNIIFLIVGGVLLSLVFVKLADNYISDMNNIKREVTERPTDINLIMGRIAGIFIFPEMIKDNPLLGIGLGNYPIMRNNPNYLGVIPTSPAGETDAHGYGGLAQLLVDGGLIIFMLFMYVIFLFYKKIKLLNNGLENYLLIFLCFFVFGVQLYFLYPWVLFGILISLTSKEKVHA